MTRSAARRAWVVGSAGCGLVLTLAVLARPLAAEPKPWSAPGEMPIPEWARSAEVTRPDEPLYLGPSTAEKRRGAVAKGARLGLFGSQRGPGCSGRFLLVGPLAWLCEDGAELSRAAPDGDAVLPTAHDGLPYRYHFVGPDGSFGYRALQTAEEGVPDAQLLKGFGVAVMRVESSAEGNPFGLTTEGLWVPMRDLNPVQPFPFHGRELDGSLNVAWVVTANAVPPKVIVLVPLLAPKPSPVTVMLPAAVTSSGVTASKRGVTSSAHCTVTAGANPMLAVIT